MFAALVIALALRVGAVALELHPQRPPLQLANLPCSRTLATPADVANHRLHQRGPWLDHLHDDSRLLCVCLPCLRGSPAAPLCRSPSLPPGLRLPKIAASAATALWRSPPHPTLTPRAANSPSPIRTHF